MALLPTASTFSRDKIEKVITKHKLPKKVAETHVDWKAKYLNLEAEAMSLREQVRELTKERDALKVQVEKLKVTAKLANGIKQYISENPKMFAELTQ